MVKDKIEAIKLIGKFLMNYDSDGHVDMYGFNGIIPGTTHSSRFFAMNGKIFDPDVNGINCCVRLYQQATETVR